MERMNAQYTGSKEEPPQELATVHLRGQYEGGVSRSSITPPIRYESGLWTGANVFDPLSPTLVSNSNTASRYRPSASFWFLLASGQTLARIE